MSSGIVVLKKAKKEFFDYFYAIKSESQNVYWSGHDLAPIYQTLKNWFIDQLEENKNRIIFEILHNNKSVGYLYFDVLQNKTIELSYAISKTFSGKGIATLAVSSAITYAKENNYHDYIIKAFVANNNMASKKIMSKNNFFRTSITYKQILKKTNEEVIMQEYTYNERKVFIIAEAGVNHNGDINLAKKLIDVAVESGVDAVKFQTWKTELLVTKDAQQAEYQTQNTGLEESQFDMLKRLELSYDDFKELKDYCDIKNIMFLSTPDEPTSANFLSNLQDIFKIGSGELTNIPFLRHIGKMKKKIILSTGMGTLSEIEKAISILIEAGTKKEDMIILHATTQYPTPMDQVNLNAMNTIKDAFKIKVGYSDHTMGIDIPIAAVALGAKVIEKHYTLCKEMDGPDHKASLEPDELKNMVNSIRNIENALGDGIKIPQTTELDNLKVVRKSIIAKTKIKKGDKFTYNNLETKRVGEGLSSILWDEIVGLTANKDFNIDELIRL